MQMTWPMTDPLALPRLPSHRPLGRENARVLGQPLPLRRGGGPLTFETSAQIADDGSVALRMSHASQYAIVIDDKNHGENAAQPTLNAQDHDAYCWATRTAPCALRAASPGQRWPPSSSVSSPTRAGTSSGARPTTTRMCLPTPGTTAPSPPQQRGILDLRGRHLPARWEHYESGVRHYGALLGGQL